MTMFGNSSVATDFGGKYKDYKVVTPKISEIENLQDLKQFCCAKNKYLKDWYMKCFDCPGLKTCMAGQQAVKLLEESTSPTPPAKPAPATPPDLKTNLRGYIEYVFTQKDPVKILLESSQNIRPTSLYSRVHMWKKNHPDLEEKYHMLEKVRFLFTKPWDRMRVPDILKEDYPGKVAEKQDIPEPVPVPAPDAKVLGLKQDAAGTHVIEDGSSDSDGILLEDFLKEYGVDIQEDPDEAVNENVAEPGVYSGVVSVKAVPEKKEEIRVSDSVTETQADIRTETHTKAHTEARAVAAVGDRSDIDRMDLLVEKLRKNIAEHEKQIAEINDQIAAVLTTKKLMESLS